MKSTIDWLDIKGGLPHFDSNVLITNGKEILLGYVIVKEKKFYEYSFGFATAYADPIDTNWITHWALVPDTFNK